MSYGVLDNVRREARGNSGALGALIDRRPFAWGGLQGGSGSGVSGVSGYPGSVSAGQVSAPMISGNTINSFSSMAKAAPISSSSVGSVKPRYINVTNISAPQNFGEVRDVAFDPYKAQGISGIERVSADRVDAPQIGATLAGSSPVQDELQRQAMDELRLGGRLSAQDMRDSDQATRQAFADRGMGRANSAIFTEALNRDRFSRERAAERRAFAGGVEAQGFQQRSFDAGQYQGADMANQQAGLQGMLANQSSALQAGMANQQTQFGMDQFNAASANDASQFNSQGGLQAALANQGVDFGRAQTMYQGELQTNLANQQTRLAAAQANQGNYYQSQAANQAARLQTQLANQSAQQRAAEINSSNGLRALLANQDVGLRSQLANQDAGLRAAMSNQNTALNVYGINQQGARDRWNFSANSAENMRIRNQNMADLQTMMAAWNRG